MGAPGFTVPSVPKGKPSAANAEEIHTPSYPLAAHRRRLPLSGGDGCGSSGDLFTLTDRVT
jgi:hypothetical protein